MKGTVWQKKMSPIGRNAASSVGFPAEFCLILRTKMIIGHGIDIEELSSIQRAYEKMLASQKSLDREGMACFEELSGQGKIEYLAGRWSAKEAFPKHGGQELAFSFQDLEVLDDERGAPVFTKTPFLGRFGIY